MTPRLRASTAYYYVRDLDRALAFYTEVMGLPLAVRFGDSWAEVDAGTITIGLHATEDPTAGAPGGATVSFSVEDLELLVAQLRERGAKVSEIRSPERGKFAMVTDPDGNLLHLIEFSPSWVEKTGYPDPRKRAREKSHCD